jgi:hypothetical protein
VFLAVLAAAPAAAGQEPPASVQGAGSAADAPRLPPGSYADLIGEPETLWYAIEAGQGQQLAATVVVRGRPEGVSTASSELRVAILDAQLRPSGEPATGAFTGVADTQVQIVGEPLPEVGADGAYLTVSLASPTGANDLRDLGYQLEFAVAVGGEAVPLEETVTAPAEDLFNTPERTPQPAPASFADTLPVALFALALGAFGGYELTRRRLRHR